jgi:hypothetical protein
MRLIGFTLAARDIDDIMSGFDKTRHDICADVAGTAKDDQMDGELRSTGLDARNPNAHRICATISPGVIRHGQERY